MNKRTRNSVAQAASAVTQQQQQPQQQVLVHQEYSGQLPPPHMLREFDLIQPGTSAKLMQWIEEEQIHRRAIEVQVHTANVDAQRRQVDLAHLQNESQTRYLTYQAETIRRSDRQGQYLGFVICLAAMGAAVYLAMNNHEWVAGAVAAIPSGAIILSFRTLTSNRKKAESS